MTFDATYTGAIMKGTGAIYSLRSNGYFAGASVALDDNAVARSVALTGYVAISAKGNKGYQTTDGNYIILSEGWQKVGTQAIMQYSQSQAQALVNTIIKNNQIILCNNLICARYASRLTSKQQAQVRELENRLESRNNTLLSGGMLTNIKTSHPEGFAELSPYLEKLMEGEAIGVASWVVIVIVATVIASLSTAVYFACKYIALESEQDVKFSKQLTATLTQKLTPEEYQQLLNETKGIATKSRIAQLISSNAGWIGWATALIGGYIAYRVLKNRKVL